MRKLFGMKLKELFKELDARKHDLELKDYLEEIKRRKSRGLPIPNGQALN